MDDIQFQKSEEFIRTLMHEYQIPGISLAIVNIKNGSLKSCGYGVRQVSEKNPVTSSTKMCIGSITKGFTSVLLASLLQHQKKITWDTPLKDIFGADFEFSDLFRSERACLRDLLAHKMGIELGESDFGWMCGGVNRSTMKRHLRALPCAADFRTKLMYNNFMYTIAAQVAGRLGNGSSWEELIQTNIFDLLGMKDSGFIHQTCRGDEREANFAHPHMKVAEGLKEIPLDIHRNCDSIAPAGCIYTSADDMCQWMKFLLDKGKIYCPDEIQIIDKKFLEQCWKPQFSLPRGKQEWDGYVSRPDFPVSETRDTYGFGWYLGTYREYSYVAHGGELLGYDSLITLYHDLGIGIYTCLNGPAGEQAAIGNQLIHYVLSDLHLGLKPWLDVENIKNFPEPWARREKYFTPHVHVPVNKNLPATRSLDDYCGKYTHDFMGKIAVSISIEHSALMMSYGNGLFLLYPNGGTDEFRLVGLGLMDFIHQLDMFAPSEWMMVKFEISPVTNRVDGLLCSLFESGPMFLKS